MSGANEAWSTRIEPNHWYGHAFDMVVDTLRGSGDCLVIGSPIVEANGLADMGWSVTYFDIRTPPEGNFSYVQGDARRLPFPDEHFDALSSTCVLCHVGTGRYGDEKDTDLRGDDVMLGEIARVLKPDAKAFLMWGPCDEKATETKDLEGLHRVYCLEEMRSFLVKHKLALLHRDIHDNYLSTVVMK